MKQKNIYCDNCKWLESMCVCGNDDKIITEKQFRQIRNNRLQIINDLAKEYPKDFLGVIDAWDEYPKLLLQEALPVGLFKCIKCSKIIEHNQYRFSRLCPSCDIGKDSPKWTIIKPLKERIVDRLTENEI